MAENSAGRKRFAELAKSRLSGIQLGKIAGIRERIEILRSFAEDQALSPRERASAQRILGRMLMALEGPIA